MGSSMWIIGGWRRLAAVAAGLAAVVSASAAEAASESAFMRVYGPVQPPYGFIQFCESFPAECRDSAREPQRISASPDRLADLDDVNRAINAAIQPATDMEIWGVSEYWTLPVTRGDCEDYALLKRKMLIARGWPSGALLMTVVRDEKGEGHAVLTVRTQQGDFILDNKVDEIRIWHKTPYEFVMRQSYVNNRVWLSLDPRHGASPDAIAGLARGWTRSLAD